MKPATEIKQVILERADISEEEYALNHYEAFETYIKARTPKPLRDKYRKNAMFRAWFCRCIEAAERNFVAFEKETDSLTFYLKWRKIIEGIQGYYPPSRIENLILNIKSTSLS